ncbi:hypothetical protein VMCG_01403 [Cytospora schulzeri]|uniref:Extracellular matrix protein n=1 Tax=Cytospora schulzeri TaxID=448051 RepID=A0A423X6E4_9PEZI|nr:hypothetical protein VMCG_01403 [Valsa malicola]
MKFNSGLLAIVAALPSTLAVEFTNSDFAVTAGKSFTLTWSDADGPVTITLKDGASTDLKDVEVLATGLTGTSYTWTPDSSLTSATYAFEIDDDSGTPNYSPQFQYQGSASASASTTLASSTSGSSTASSTASSTGSTTGSTTASGSSTSTGSSSSVTSSTGTTSDSSTSATESASTKDTSSTSSSKSSSAAATDSPSTTSTPVNTNDSKKLGSPLALVLGGLISLMVFN